MDEHKKPDKPPPWDKVPDAYEDGDPSWPDLPYGDDDVVSYSSWHSGSDKNYESDGPPWPCNFRMGRSSITATGQPSDNCHLNVWKLSISRSPLERTAIALIRRLPNFVQDIVAGFLPGLFLPDRVVLKKTKKGWEEEFENEKSMYERLESLQGRIIPKFYGEATCEEGRALIFSEVVGIMPWEQKAPPLDAEQFKELVEVAFQELNVFGLAYDDVKLDNMIMTEGGVVLVDLESLYDPGPEHREFCFDSDREQVLVVYNRYLKNYEAGDCW